MGVHRELRSPVNCPKSTHSAASMAREGTRGVTCLGMAHLRDWLTWDLGTPEEEG